jgi:NADH-quinone oxidoreductase subunit D
MPHVQEIEVKELAGRVVDRAEALDPAELGEVQGEKMVLNMGPSHPSTHGVLRIILELDGEIITKAVPDVGFCIAVTRRLRRT